MSNRQKNEPIRVLIVEDSRAQRELLIRLIEASGKFEIVGTAINGEEGVAMAHQLRPHVIAMDIHLPVLDGYEATRRIMQSYPIPIVMVSNSMGDEGRRSVEALAAGAVAVLRKPGSPISAAFETDRANLLRTLELMADVPVVTRHPPRTFAPTTIKTKPTTSHTSVLAVAASTGGPAAVQIVLSGLGSHFPLPILLVQHIARGFVEALVDWLNTTIPLKVVIAQPNQRMEPGVVYLAPDERHIFAVSKGYIGLRDNVATDRFCPSADVLFESIAQVYGSEAIGVILTGMGDDGAKGMRSMRVRNGQTYAQDEASCVVYGMPHAAVSAGAVVRVAPLDQIAPAILQYLGTDVLSATGR